MSTVQVSESFKTSYKNFENYPHNLIYQAAYPPALKAYTSRLNSSAPKLFVEKDADTKVSFRDLFSNGLEELDKQNVVGDGNLRSWLGDQLTTDPLNSTLVGTVVKRDPKCRFIHVLGKHSRSSLKITREMMVRILTWHQVMPGYLDFISVFGSQTRPRDSRFSGFREQSLLSTSARGPTTSELGNRSGRQFQLCYNVKSVESDSTADTTPKLRKWSIRQAAIHHQFDVENGASLWIMTKGNEDFKDRVQEMTSDKGRPQDRNFEKTSDCFKSSLAIHLMCCHWSTEGWRWYIQWLEEVIDQDTELAVLGPRGLEHARHKYTPEELQTVQNYADMTNEAIMILSANNDVLNALRTYYEDLMKHKDLRMDDDCSENVATFATQVNYMIYDIKMQISRAKLLVQITADRKSLVLQHLQSQTTEKMEKLTENMHKIGVMAQKEAIAMRIITVVTLIYLPATFVSTFFSTDVVKYQNQNGNEQGNQKSNSNFSSTALYRWLEVTLPLTALTLVGALLWYYNSNRRRQRLPFFSMPSKASTYA